jgi:hypothetical protein
LIKPDSLRRLLLSAVPNLQDNPERLLMFIDQGRLASRGTRKLAFEYRYKLNIVVQDYAGAIDDIMVPILAWISEFQPDLLERGEREPFSFDSELMDANSADVSIDIELTEVVLVERRPGGGFDVVHVPEPSRCDAFPGVEETANLWQLLLRDEIEPSVTAIPE